MQALRNAAGEPSYAEIARAVGRLREQRGISPAAALPPRTTVYDVFRVGRRRLDRELVADIVEVLGGTPVPDAVPITPTAPVSLTTDVPDRQPEPGAGAEAEPEPVPAPAPADLRPPAPGRRTVAWILLLSVVVNVVGQIVMTGLNLPIWQDMTGTAVAAIALGPWWGVAVFVSNLVFSLLDKLVSGFIALAFLDTLAAKRAWLRARLRGRRP